MLVWYPEPVPRPAAASAPAASPCAVVLGRFPIRGVIIWASAACSSRLEPRVGKMQTAICLSEPRARHAWLWLFWFVFENIAAAGFTIAEKGAFAGLLHPGT